MSAPWDEPRADILDDLRNASDGQWPLKGKTTMPEDMFDPQMPRQISTERATVDEAFRRYTLDATFHTRVEAAVRCLEASGWWIGANLTKKEKRIALLAAGIVLVIS